jgi:hypothetical protein
MPGRPRQPSPVRASQPIGIRNLLNMLDIGGLAMTAGTEGRHRGDRLPVAAAPSQQDDSAFGVGAHATRDYAGIQRRRVPRF